MKNKVTITLILLFLISFITAGIALADKKDDVMALLQKGHDFILKHGIEKAVEDFPKKDLFWNGQLHLFAYNYKGDCIAHGLRPEKVGKNFWKLKTPEGTYHIQTMINIAKKGGGWHEYRWMHPKTKKLAVKVSYVLPIKGMDAYLGCGFWKE